MYEEYSKFCVSCFSIVTKLHCILREKITIQPEKYRKPKTRESCECRIILLMSSHYKYIPLHKR